MQICMDVDVALAEVPVNILPLLDDTDFKTIEAAVVYNQAGLALFWNFVTTAGAQTCTAVTPTSSGDYDWTDQGTSGMYAIEMPASGGASINNDTEGFGWFTGVATGVLPWRGPIICFRAAALNNSLIDAGATGLLAPTTAARTLDVTATGAAGIDWANVENPTTSLNLSATNIDVDQVVASVSGNVATLAGAATVVLTDASLTAAKIAADAITAAKIADGAIDAATFAAGAINAAAIAADAITDAKVAADVTIASVTGAVGSVTGAVGSVTGAVGSVTGAVGSIASGGITAASFAANAITAAKLDPDVTTELQAGLATAAALATVDGIVDDILVDTGTTLQGELDGIQADTEDIQARLPAALVGGRIDATVDATGMEAGATAAIADAVWDEAASGHVVVGTFGQRVAIVRAETAQAGASTTITLDASASAVDDFYNNAIIHITAGTGVGQARIISDYVGATKVASVSAWATNPSSDSVFVIHPFGSIPGASAPTAAEVADAVWDEDATAHQTQGTFGQAIGDPAADGNTIFKAVVTDATGATVGIDAAAILADTGTDGVALAANSITAGVIADGAIDAATFAAAAITAASIASDAITDAKVASDVTIASVTGAVGSVTGAVGSVTGAVGSIASGGITAASFAANAITAAKLDPDVTTELQAGLATAAALATVDGIVDDILLDTAEIGTAGAGLTNINLPNQTMDIVGNITGNLSGSVGSVSGAVGSVTGAVGSVASGGIIAASFGANAITAAKLDPDVTTELQAGLATAASVATLQTSVDDVPTNAELVTSQAAADDATLAAIAALNNLSQANIRTAVGLASANLDTQLDALPTAAELTTALVTADDAVLTAIAALSIPTATQNADALLGRDLGSGSGAGTLDERTVRSSLRFNRNKFTIAGGTLTVYREDDTTVAFTAAITQTAGNPVSASDPA